MTPAEIRTALDKGPAPDVAFKVLRSIASLLAANPNDSQAQALLIRSLEHREAFKGCEGLLNALLRETGLYPYAEPDKLSTRDRLALELHRPFGVLGESGTVFHRVQAQVYWHLLDGENVILSAPTSFGKSLIIDAIIASKIRRRIVLVVPTIALIDETRRRLARFTADYKIITHGSQMPSNDGRGTVYVLTQERVIERSDLEDIDLVIIDEFYKLDPSGGADRAAVLNHAFYKLLKTARQFYLLGPNIRTVPVDFRSRFAARLIVSDYMTVATDVKRVDVRPGKREALVQLAAQLDAPTLIYCQSPGSVRRVVALLLEREITPASRETREAVAWIGRHFHPEWIVARALARGIGVHHGRLPRALAQLQVRLFNEGRLKFLVCTSTLIEGVNTAAKHVVIYDNQVSRAKFDYFTFKNIQGRSGRMFRHFVGTVHLFHEPPHPDLLDVDIPAFTQTDAASDSLLIQLEEPDLTPSGRQRVDRFQRQSDLSFDTIKANAHINPQQQIDLARHIARNAYELQPTLAWRGEPTGDQLFAVCELLFDTLLSGVSRDTVRSGRHLAFLVKELRQAGGAPAFIRMQAQRDPRGNPDDRVENALEFLRNWASFHLPRALTALERIQAEVYSRLRMPVGDYSAFAVRLENLFLPPALAALDEYGIPLQTVEQIAKGFRELDSLDEVLEAMRRVDPDRLGLTAFEASLIRELQRAL